MLPDLKSFAERLEYARDNCGGKVRWFDVAAAAGIAKSNISCYRRGDYLPSGVTLLRISRFLNVDAIWLAGNDIELPEDGLDLLTMMYSALDEVSKEKILDIIKSYFGESKEMEVLYEQVSQL